MLRSAALLRKLFRFNRSHDGVAAVEFAFIAPFLIVCLLGCFELVKYITALRRVGYISSAIAEEISQNTTGQLTSTDLHFYIDSSMVIFPQVLKDAARNGNLWWQDISVTMTGVNFTASPSGCTSSCSYVPSVVWTGGGQLRSCSVPLTQSSDTATPSPQTLPPTSTGPDISSSWMSSISTRLSLLHKSSEAS